MDFTTQLASALAGRYTIEREIGRGGMATVYLARDERHRRSVALKVLNPDLGAVLGVERFLSEITVTANLQHPNLLPLFDSGEADGLLFYVMPFVEGETLRHRIDREKQLPVDEALRIAAGVASALEYAHAHGVIHRDLKPENILLQAGQPVVADFGIALAVSKAGGQRVTQTGLSLGTPQYMSPEQATGDRIIDGRSDIYSLGAVTYEMLTGEPPHTGATMQAIVARVLTEPPRRVRASRPSTPAHVDAAIDIALAKLAADRWSSARDFADALQGKAVSRPAGTSTGLTAEFVAHSPIIRRQRILITALAIATLAATLGAAREWWTRAHAPPPPATRFVVALRDNEQLESVTGQQAVISPDGRAIAYAARTDKGVTIFYRRLDELSSRALPGTNDPSDLFFSRDGRSIGFAQDRFLKSVSIAGGAPTTIAEINLRGASVMPDGQIVMGTPTGLFRVGPTGGRAESVAVRTSGGAQVGVGPLALGDGNHVLVWGGAGGDTNSLRVVRLDTKQARDIDGSATNPIGVVDGWLFFGRPDGTIAATRFDPEATKSVNDAVPVLEGVLTKGQGGVAASLSTDGTLLYVRGTSTNMLRLVDERGATLRGDTERRVYSDPQFSPDGTRIAVTVATSTSRDIWVHDIASGVLRRVTSGGRAMRPEWTRDGKRIAYIAGGFAGGDRVWWVPADNSGPEEELFQVAGGGAGEVTFSPDGKYAVVRTSGRTHDALLVPLAGERKATPLLASKFSENQPVISPDGKLLAYVSDESGTSQIYVRPFLSPGGTVQISASGGLEPQWSRDGRLFYRTTTALMVATLRTSPSIAVASQQVAFEDPTRANASRAQYSIDPSGKQFVVLRYPREFFPEMVVVLNWMSEVRAKLARR